jgi:hypothetical protein
MTDAIHEIYKHRLGPDGETRGSPERQENLGQTVQTEGQLKQLALAHNERQQQQQQREQAGGCGNCYGAREGCCDSCQQVRDAYAAAGWHFQVQGIAQCTREAEAESLREQFSEDGGCQIFGRLELSRGSGQFHVAPHKKFHLSGGAQLGAADGGDLSAGFFSLLDLISFTFDQFNVTHRVNALSFGENFPGIESPLDGEVRTVEDTHGMYQYYIKVVPTRYRSLGSWLFSSPQENSVIESNQYSVTEHMSHLSPGSGRGLPGVYFTYEVSPINALFEEKRGGTLAFLTSACAILGGMFTVMGLLDGLVNGLVKILFRDVMLD